LTITVEYLGGPQVSQINLDNDAILEAVEGALVAAGQGKTVIEPRMHLKPRGDVDGHFNVLRGYVEPLDYAGVKIVGDYVDNYSSGLPSEMGLINLFCPSTGSPRAIVDAAGITDMRTGAVTAIGAKYLAPAAPRVLGHIGARGTAYWNVRLLDHLFDFEEIRVHSRRPESREAFAARLTADLNKNVVATDNWQDCLEGADIQVEASRLLEPKPLFDSNWVRPGTLVVPMNAGPYGALRPHINAGRITESSFAAEIGQIAAGVKPARQSADETILFWHRGLSTSDIALAARMLERGREMGLVMQLPYA